MAGLITAAMVLIELAVMREMSCARNGMWSRLRSARWTPSLRGPHPRPGSNLGQRVPEIGDSPPKCRDPDVQRGVNKRSRNANLCQAIVTSQQAEIDQMKQILERLGE